MVDSGEVAQTDSREMREGESGFGDALETSRSLPGVQQVGGQRKYIQEMGKGQGRGVLVGSWASGSGNIRNCPSESGGECREKEVGTPAWKPEPWENFPEGGHDHPCPQILKGKER